MTIIAAALVPELRLMVAEPDITTYTDAAMQECIERYPLIDGVGRTPLLDDGVTANPTWLPVYDLNAAAASIWGHKAAAFAGLYDFTADGGTFHRSQAAQEMRKQARYYAARRAPSSLRIHVDPNYERDMQSTYPETAGLAGGEFYEAEGDL